MATAASAATAEADSNAVNLDIQLQEMNESIKDVEGELKVVKRALSNSEAYLLMEGEELKNYLHSLMRDKELHLRDKELVREEKAKLLDRQQATGELLVTG